MRGLLPPGVLVSQKALQMQWEISFLRSFIYLFIYFSSLSLSLHPLFQNTEGRHANEWKPLIICYEVMRLTLPCGYFFFFFFPISAGKVLRGNAEVPWRYVTLRLTGEDYNIYIFCFFLVTLTAIFVHACTVHKPSVRAGDCTKRAIRSRNNGKSSRHFEPLLRNFRNKHSGKKTNHGCASRSTDPSQVKEAQLSVLD